MSDDRTRRDFLKHSAAVAAALAAGGKLLHAQTASPAPKAASAPVAKPAVAATTNSKYSKLRVGFVGVGNKGRHNLNVMTECGVNVAALCDIDGKMLETAVKDHPSAKTYTDFRKMLETQGKELDAVVVSTPDHTH